VKILVAGGAGFIPSYLCKTLLEQNHEVWALDNLVTGRRQNIEPLLSEKNFTFVQGDITQPQDIPKQRFHQIFNMASPASPVDFKKIPLEIMYTGAIGQKNLLEKAHEDSSRILFTSTSEVYGDPLVNPQPETYYGNVNCIGERSCYDEAKRFGEALTMTFHKVYGLETRILRIFNTYGPGMRPDDGRVIPNFFMQALQGEGLSIYGEGTQTRSLCYVSDMVAGVIALMNSTTHLPVNIGGQKEMTILQLADLVNEITGNKAPHRFFPLPQNDPKVRRPDTTRAKAELSWAPLIDTEVGFEKTMEYFKKFI